MQYEEPSQQIKEAWRGLKRGERRAKGDVEKWIDEVSGVKRYTYHMGQLNYTPGSLRAEMAEIPRMMPRGQTIRDHLLYTDVSPAK